MPTKPLLSIIIVSYGTAELTVDTLRSIEADVDNSEPLKKRVEVIIVDNNSKDDSVKKIKDFQKTTKLNTQIIENKSNDGFAAANNIGLSAAKADLYLLLNSDTYVQQGSLEKLVKTANLEQNESTAVLSSRQSMIDNIGIIAPTLLNEDGTIQPQGGSTPTLCSLTCHLLMLDDLPVVGKLLPSTQHTGLRFEPFAENDYLVKRDWVGGTAMLIKKELIDAVGLLDENIFMYGEDVELCMRANNHHWDVVQQTNAYITHFQSASSSSLNAVLGEMRGYLYIFRKHKQPWQYLFAKFIIKLGIWLRILIFGTIGQEEKRKLYSQVKNKL